MSGKRLGSFRSGDRSEYLALFALSRLAFVSPIPRQEDFGVPDFLCVLGKEDGGLVFAQNAFYVQVKSSAQDLVFEGAAFTWIANHMDLPLIVCVVGKTRGKLRLYSTWNIWRALFEPEENVSRLVLRFDTPLPLQAPTFSLDSVADVPVGQPIIDVTIDEVEQGGAPFFAVLERWIEIDKQNIASRAIGRIFVRGFWNWEPNKLPLEESRRTVYFFDSQGAWKRAEEAVAPILTAIAHNYRHNQMKAPLEALRPMLCQLRPYLDKHGLGFAEGTLDVQED